MDFHIDSDSGFIELGFFSVSWGNALEAGGLYLPGYTSFNFGKYSLEMGEVDQGKPGIYLTEYVLDEPYPLFTLWQAK